MKRWMLPLIVCISMAAKADEGMWMPQLIEALNYSDMKKNGFKLTPEQIYSINKASMKDAVAIFGGGCTSECISSNGLILTNHHCGFSSIAALSTVERDYLKNGYFAMNQSEELPCKGLSVTFIRRIEDVTSAVLASIKTNYSEAQKDSAIQVTMKGIEKEATKNTKMSAFVRGFYYGNEFYLFITEVFNDVRLVGTPPENIGKFGGETDNWVWPRHNADFSMFRIYANASNQPAEYNESNVPYKPAYVLPISLKGVKEGDFTMVYGFPGRTQEYLTSYAVDLLMNEQDPLRVGLRDKRLSIMESEMKKNDTIRLMYVSKYANVANAYKKWKGEMLGLKKTGAVQKKRQFEADFLKSLEGDKAAQEKAAGLMKSFEKAYAEYGPYSRQNDYYYECLMGIDGFRMIQSFVNVFAELKKKKEGKENKFAELMKVSVPAIPFKNYNTATDIRLARVLFAEFVAKTDPQQMPSALDSLLKTFDGNVDRMVDHLYKTSLFVDAAKAKNMYLDFEQNAAFYSTDVYYQLVSRITQHFQKTVFPQVSYYEKQIFALQKDYMQLIKTHPGKKKIYPDANGTLRVAYGKVEGYEGADAMMYRYYTTLDGLVDKHNTGEEDFAVTQRLLDLYAAKDYGQYADKDGRLHTAFIASNHTTGGNSGSPVMNARGELIGTNFDRNWEGTMSDVMYNVTFCRNIVLDVRFTLWVVDKYAGAGYLLKEMKINK